MNSFLLNRAIGSISPSAFHVAQTSHLTQLLEPAPGIRFSSRKGPVIPDGTDTINSEVEVFAHQAGVNVLAIDHYEGR